MKRTASRMHAVADAYREPDRGMPVVATLALLALVVAVAVLVGTAP